MEAARTSETLVSYHISTYNYIPEDGVSMDLRNVGILPHHYTVSQPRRPRIESSPPQKPQISTLDGDEWLAAHQSPFIPEKVPPTTHWLGGRVGPSVDLDTVAERQRTLPTHARNPVNFRVILVKLRYSTFPFLEKLVPLSINTTHLGFDEYIYIYIYIVLNGKGKVAPVLNCAPRHEGVLGSGNIASRILDLGTR
jgi:hypothetical protein